METTILCRSSMGVMRGLYRDHGKENGGLYRDHGKENGNN